MPLWIAVGLSGYATHLLWQLTKLIAFDRAANALFAAAVFFLVKLGLLLVAASYWIPRYCQQVQQLSPWLLLIPALLSAFEVFLAYATIKENFDQLRKSPLFYPSMLVQLCVTVALPFALFAVAYHVLIQEQCA